MSTATRTIRAVVLVVLAGVVLWGVVAGITSGHQPDRVRSLAAQLRCPVCNGESVADSPSSSARSIENEIRRQVAGGWTDAQIIQFYVDRFGPSIRLAPPRSGSALLLWIAPIVAITGGAIAVGGMLTPGRRRTVLRWGAGALGVLAVSGLVVAGARQTTARPPFDLAGAAPDSTPGRDLATVTDAEMERVIAENPNVIGMRLALAERYLDQGKVEDAIRHTAMAIEMPANDQEYERALRLHGWASALNGAPAAGTKYLRAALALSPTDRDALFFLAKVNFEALHDPVAARTVLDQLLALEMQPRQRTVVQALSDAVDLALAGSPQSEATPPPTVPATTVPGSAR